MNSVQEAMLAAVTIRHKEQDLEIETFKFEQNMLIANPAMYSEYMKNKQEQEASGNAGITWAAPDSIEEARELMDIFNDIDEQLKQSNDSTAADEEFVNQVNFMQLLGGINLDEIGGED